MKFYPCMIKMPKLLNINDIKNVNNQYTYKAILYTIFRRNHFFRIKSIVRPNINTQLIVEFLFWYWANSKLYTKYIFVYFIRLCKKWFFCPWLETVAKNAMLMNQFKLDCFLIECSITAIYIISFKVHCSAAQLAQLFRFSSMKKLSQLLKIKMGVYT